MNAVGKQIKKRRKELGLTQEDLAIELGYKSKSSINKVEMGINDLTYSRLLDFAKVLKTTPAYLMGWAEEIPDNNNYLQDGAIPLVDNKTNFSNISASKKFYFYSPNGSKTLCHYAFKSTSPNMIKARINKGDIVFIKKVRSLKEDDVCLVKIDNALHLKRYKFIPERKLVLLKSENPLLEDLFFSPKEIKKLEVIGKCIAFQSMVK